MDLPNWLPEWLRPQQKDENAESVRGTGPITAMPLNRLQSLTVPFARDPFYRLRPAFSHEAAGLSLELARAAYTLELDPWMQAGWDDISVQVDNSLHTGLGSGGDKAALQGMLTSGKLYLARAAMQDKIALGPLVSSLRHSRSESTKAVVMLHRLEDGQYLVAIGFMGTGKRINDWLSNLRISTEEGFHKGFHQLCTHFEQNLDKIHFPAAARQLGLEKLTLSDVLLEMRSLRSRFRLWMAGHSQGSAVMQIFAHRLITHRGVLPQNITGYGFASPTVATGRLVYDPASYPLSHILNSDDLVTKMGAVVHLGICLEHSATPRLREESYHFSIQPEKQELRKDVDSFRQHIQDGPSLLMCSWALLTALSREIKPDQGNSQDRRWYAALWGQAMNYAGKTAAGWLDSLVDYLERSYQDITGHAMAAAEQQHMLAEVMLHARQHGLRNYVEAWMESLTPPHRIVKDGQDGAYAFIVKHGLSELMPFIWVKPARGLPCRRYAAFPMKEGEVVQAFHMPATRRAQGRRIPVYRGVRRMGVSVIRKGK